jgi:hypothetical protein
MPKHMTPRRLAITLAIAAVAIAVPVGAFAYFSTTGEGSGSAAVGSATGIALSSTGQDVTGTLYPGGADASVTVLVENRGDGAQYVGDVAGAVADNGNCLGAWFVVDTVAVDENLARGADTAATTKIRMLDSGTNQNACQGKTMAIDWTSTAAP